MKVEEHEGECFNCEYTGCGFEFDAELGDAEADAPQAWVGEWTCPRCHSTDCLVEEDGE